VRLKKKHRLLLYLLKTVAARQKGMGFRLMKFHAVLHLADDILMFGVPMVVDTGSNESHHKTTKIAAKLTQKDATTFESQTSNRMDDFHVLELALQEINSRPLWEYYSGYQHRQVLEPKDEESTTGGMKMTVRWDDDKNQVMLGVLSKMKNAHNIQVDTSFLQYVLAIEMNLYGLIESKILIYSEHKRNGIMFRAHPSYRGKGPWRDWVMIQWSRGSYPAMIWGFLDLRELQAGVEAQLKVEDTLPNGNVVFFEKGTTIRAGVWAVIESCNYKTPKRRDRGLFEEIILDTRELAEDTGEVLQRRFYLVEVESFQQPIVVIPNIGTKIEFLMMTPRARWSDAFIKWLEDVHKDDQKVMEG